MTFGDREKQIVENVFKQLIPDATSLIVSPQERAIALADKLHDDIELFAPNEWAALLALAESYPHYCPFELLMARMTATSPEYNRQLWQKAQQKGPQAFRAELAPIRDAFKRMRPKLKRLDGGLDIVPLHKMGYMLLRNEPQ